MKNGEICDACKREWYNFDPCCANASSLSTKEKLDAEAQIYFKTMPKPPHHMVYSNATVNEARRLGYIDGLIAARKEANPTK